MQQPAPLAVEIIYAGRRWRVSLASVRSILREGLTPLYIEILALTADAWTCSIPELMALAMAMEGGAR